MLRLAPGQITDDGELTLALARALCDAQEYPTEQVARHYQRWISSSPFDVGNAARMAMDCSGQATLPRTFRWRPTHAGTIWSRKPTVR